MVKKRVEGMKKALIKDSFKEIKIGYKRFISILLMALLGVGFFAGLRATSPDMLNSINQYYQNQNVYDIQVMSTLGLTQEDIDALKNIENVQNVYGTYSKDVLIETEDKELVTKVMSIEEVNKPRLVEGNMPQNTNECLVEPLFLQVTNKKIGDTIQVTEEDTQQTSEDEEQSPTLKEKELVITGTAQSPLYLSMEKGTSNLGAGKVDYYIYVPKENITSDIFTEIYITLQNAQNYTTNTAEYQDYVKETKDKIEAIKEERQQARYNSLITKANDKITEAQNELNTQKQEGENKIAEAENQINEGKAEIVSGEQELEEQQTVANSKFRQAEQQIASAKQTLATNQTQYEEQKKQAKQSFAQAETQKQELQKNLQTVETSLTTLNEQYEKILEELKKEDITEQEKAVLEQTKQELETQKQSLEQNQEQLNKGIAQIEEQTLQGKEKLQQAEAQLAEAKNTIEEQEKTLQETKVSTNTQIANAKQTIEQSKQEIQQAETELQIQKEEFNTKIQEAEAKLLDAKEKVNEIKNPELYILDREQNQGYASYIQDTKSIENLSIVFPIVFFAIAALVSLTSMTRMVEEERQEIGTLKALGYNKLDIALKYVLYSSLASIIGGIIGMNIGFQLLPRIIWMMYSMMYKMPDIIVSFNFTYATIGLGLIYLCIVGATIYAVLKEVKEQPATLLRPKAPKLGKRVLLERITPIWKRLNFTQKVTIRNIFRYKKRFFMTILGICGSTALILTGFGIKDSISAIIPNQYEKIFHYDMQVSLKSALEETQIQDFVTKLEQQEGITQVAELNMISGTTKNGELQEDVQIIIPKDRTQLDKIMSLQEVKTKQKIELNTEGIVLTDKLAQLIDVQVGDTVTIEDANHITKEVKVAHIAENYISHYVYMTKELYEELFEKTYQTNILYLQDNNLSEEQENAIATELLKQNEVTGVSLISTALSSVNNMMNSLNYVVIILIVSAGLLAFVVSYNLSNVNISERIRELATIKVLGFYDKEVYDYVTRETIILTIIGILFGLVAGYFLNFYIIGTCEIDMLRFVKEIHIQSYVYAVAITILFTFIVNFITYFALKKIDMLGSLKSVE